MSVKHIVICVETINRDEVVKELHITTPIRDVVLNKTVDHRGEQEAKVFEVLCKQNTFEILSLIHI